MLKVPGRCSQPSRQAALRPVLTDIARQVWEAMLMAKLTPVEIRLINRFYLNGMDVDQIAKKVGMDEKTICDILLRALKKIHESGELNTHEEQRQVEAWGRGILE